MRKTLIGVLAATLATGSLGCVFVGDLLNPSLASSLGIASGTSNLGSIVIRLNNQASDVAFMSAITSTNSTDPTVGLNPGGGFIQPNEALSLVADCPVTAIYVAGAQNASVASADTALPAASVISADGMATDVTYAGAALMSGRDFECGDVINITLREVTSATDMNSNATYVITVEVIKGT